MTHSASARLDGLLVCESLQAGLLRDTGGPAVRFGVSAGVQTHPVWALGRLAFVVYAFRQTSRKDTLEVCLGGGLVSSSRVSVLVVDHINWFTSQRLRIEAERLAMELYSQVSLPEEWPLNVLSWFVREQI